RGSLKLRSSRSYQPGVLRVLFRNGGPSRRSNIMADIASELASKCGISADQAKKGLGVILGLFKSKLPTETFTKLTQAVPGADDMMAAADTAAPASGGVMDAIKGTVGKIFGGGSADLLAKFSQLGMTPEQGESFVAKALEFFKAKVPGNVQSEISKLLP